MKYVRVNYTDGKTTILSHDAALELLSRYYQDTEECSLEEMLNMENRYPCVYSELRVTE